MAALLRTKARAAALAVAGIAAAATLGISAPADAQQKAPAAGKGEQFFPVLVYRTGAYAPNGVPWANGYVDYLKLVNAQGGINGVHDHVSKSASSATRPIAASSATSG